jgi:hypothetical protein
MTTVAEYTAAVQNMLDTKASERGYDGIRSAVSYIDDENVILAAEADACKTWRSRVWTKCYEVMAEVQTGQMAPPTIEELIAVLPELVWP